MPSDQPLVSSAVVKVIQRQTTVQVPFAVDGEMHKEIDDTEEQEVECHTFDEVSDCPTAAEVWFEAVSCKAALHEAPRTERQKRARTHTSDLFAHSWCTFHQGSFGIQNIVSKVRNVERVCTFLRLQ